MAVSFGHSRGSQQPPPGKRARKRATQVWGSKLQLVTTVLSLLWVRDASENLVEALDHLPRKLPSALMHVALRSVSAGPWGRKGCKVCRSCSCREPVPARGPPQGFSAPAGASVQSRLGDCGHSPATNRLGCTYGTPFRPKDQLGDWLWPFS